ncbi:MAG: hypothetical protein M3379_21755, partial [Acidobacteriota bacterium]|nr:hypothetical protein [Acidobacteriota bacterium]
DDALLDLGQFEPPTSGHAAEADDFILDLEEDLPAPHAAQNLFAQPDEPSAFAEASHGTPASSFDEPASSFDERASSFGEPASSFDPSARPHDAARGHDAAAWEVVMQEPEVVAQDEPQFSAAASVEHEAGPAPRGFVEPSVVPAEEPVPAPSESEYADGSVEGDVPKPPAVAHAAPSEPSPAGYAVGEARAGVEESERAGQLSREDVDAIARRVVELMSERVIREIAWEVVPELAELLVKRKLEEEG